MNGSSIVHGICCIQTGDDDGVCCRWLANVPSGPVIKWERCKKRGAAPKPNCQKLVGEIDKTDASRSPSGFFIFSFCF